MRQKIVFVALAVAMLCSETAYAQKVVTEGSGETIKVIIDATGMPSSVVTKDKKPQTTEGTNYNSCTQDLTDLASNVNNEKVYQKFEVSKTDNATYYEWDVAVNYVCSKTINGSNGWRLPTQRELMLIWVLHSSLKKVTSFTPLKANIYWSATQYLRTMSWLVDFNNGKTRTNDKNGYHYTRCIRDI